MESFSEKEEALVKESWEIMKENIPELSLRFFSLYVYIYVCMYVCISVWVLI